jgi:hypothetical protein
MMERGNSTAVVMMANDRFIDYVIPFLESFRERNPDLRLVLIPFDDDIEKIKRLTNIYNFEVYGGDLEELDRLAERLFVTKPYLSHRLRKLAAFDMDLDEFVYIDTDIIVECSLRRLLGHLSPGYCDLVYMCNAKSVYRKDISLHPQLNQSRKFASGVFASSGRVTTAKEISRVLLENRDLFEEVRVKYLYDQPLLNFFFDLTGKKARKAQELGIWIEHKSVFRTPTSWTASTDGQHISRLTHWAGPKKFESVIPLMGLIGTYVERAQQKLSSVPELAGWRPCFSLGNRVEIGLQNNEHHKRRGQVDANPGTNPQFEA